MTVIVSYAMVNSDELTNEFCEIASLGPIFGDLVNCTPQVAYIIYDEFNGVAGTINNRLPDQVDNGNLWSTNAGLEVDGSGNCIGSLSGASKLGSIDSGSNVKDLMSTMNIPSAAGNNLQVGLLIRGEAASPANVVYSRIVKESSSEYRLDIVERISNSDNTRATAFLSGDISDVDVDILITDDGVSTVTAVIVGQTGVITATITTIAADNNVGISFRNTPAGSEGLSIFRDYKVK
jgi:hypothetical protein